MTGSRTATQRWKVGSATITSVVESQDDIPPAFLLPDATEAMVQRHPWLVPDWADADGNIGIRIQAFVVEIDGTTVLVDPCVGNHKARWLPMWNMLDTPFLDRLAGAGVVPAGVGLVVHTHLHADHVGWDTHIDGDTWVPTFTNARHLYTEAELEHVRTFLLPGEDVYGDSIGPIFDAGLADVIEPDADLGHGLRLEPTPGHTPGHTSLWVESDGDVALLLGDFMHSPLQFAEPHLAEIADADADLARETRARMLRGLARSGALVLGAHFPSRPAGRVVADGDAYRFVAC
jgi:glyoxylase-like metal-dependent hydrolase (beta-lactamase superfamily II)